MGTMPDSHGFVIGVMVCAFLTRDEIRAVENRAFDGLFTEAQLMERAGLACADKMLALYGDQMKGQLVAVVCGNG